MQKKWETIMSKEETFRKTGINFYEFNTLFQLLSIRDQYTSGKISTLLFLPCYVSYRLSGRIFNELTIASTSQLLNVEGREMNIGILRFLNLESRHFGRILMPGTIAGNVKEDYTLPSHVKMVAVCCHDTAGAILAVPSDKEYYAFISTGTWCIAGMVSKTPVLNTFALKNGFTNERGFNNSYRVLKNIIGLWLVQGLQASFKNKYSYNEIAELVRTAKTETLICPDDELFYNPNDMKEAFDLFISKTGQDLPDTPGQYFKIAYDSLCCSFRDNMDKLETMLNTRIDTIHLIGGGSQSEYLCMQTAIISRRKIIAGPAEASTIGNILAQAIALKHVKDVEESSQIVKKSFRIAEYLPGEVSGEGDRIYKLYKTLLIGG